MDFVELLNDSSERSVEVQETPLSDYHLRNPLKPMNWWSLTRLPGRQYRDRSDIIDKFGTRISVGKPTDLHLIHFASIPQQTLEVLDDAIGDLILKLRMDNGILPPQSRIDIPGILSGTSTTPTLYWNGMRFWGRMLLIMNALSSNRTPPGRNTSESPVRISMNCPYSVYVFRSCFVISDNSNDSKVYDGDWMRMVSDLYTQRWLILTAASIGRKVNPTHYPADELIRDIFSWGDNVLREMGNDGYKVIKTFESIVIGYLQTKGSGSLVPADRFIKNTLSDLKDGSIMHYHSAMKLLDCLGKIENHHHIIQVYGLHRVWGHPMVSSISGMEKLMNIGKKNIIKDNTLSLDAGRMFKLLFCKEFKNKHGSYPAIVETPTLLGTEIEENDPNAIKLSSHPLEQWDRIRFKQAFKLPETFNLSMIVADKAISPTKSELIASIQSRKTVMDSEKRRGVRRWLNDKSLDPVKFLQDINDGQFPDDHLIIGLTPKERELNPVPRMFSLMSHLLRVYVVITEQLLSDHILGMFPQITMTDTLLDLTRKMYNTVKGQSSLRKGSSREGGWVSKTVCMSLDFEKWNGHMRREMTHGVFTAIGELFGLPELYNATYDLFSKSYYYLADGSYVPEISADGELVVEEPLSFMNHKGGMEGLRQKGWTLYTVCGLEVILSKYDCEYKIMGMGDNQVLQITVYTKFIDINGRPTTEGLNFMKSTLESIFADLIQSFTASGLPLKPLETWVSEELYLYGKVPIWKGVPLTMDLKKLMRTFPMSNEGVMTLENALSTVSSNALAATQASPCIWTAYTIYNIMTSICISDFFNYHPILGMGLDKAVSESKEWYLPLSVGPVRRYEMPKRSMTRSRLRQIIALIPKSITGYNGVNIYEMMLRGFSDHLSRDLSYLHNLMLSSYTPLWIKQQIEIWYSPIYMPDKNFSMLLEDVGSVNLMSPRSPLSGVRQSVAKYLKEGMKINNPEFMQLVRAKDKDESRYLAECLCEGEELHLRLLHDVYEATVYGYIDSILSKVTKTTTIQRLAMESSADKVFKVISNDERNYYQFFKWRCQNPGEEISTMCATTRAKLLREKSWGKTLRGVTVPFPLSFLVETTCGDHGCCSCDDGFISVHFPDKQMRNDDWEFGIGGNPPYLGSMTKEKVIIGTGGKIYSGEPLVKRPINMLRTINWFVPRESNTAKVLIACTSSVTNMNVNQFLGMTEGTAGSEAHRYHDSSTFRGALTSSNFLYSTRYHISTDNLHRYSKGAENTDLHYQATFCILVELSNMYLSNRMRETREVCRFKHFKQCCYECIQPIDEDFVDLPSDKAVKFIPAFRDNEYLFTDSSKIRILEQISPITSLTDRVLTNEEYVLIPPARKRVMLERVICDRIIKDIVKGKITDTHVTVGLTSVKSYERTMFFKLSPRHMLITVMSEIRKVAAWTVMKSHPERFSYSDEELDRVMSNIISSADSHSFLGLAMFYCWEETSFKLCSSFPEIVAPSTNPVSVQSACDSIKCSLLSMIRRRFTSGIRRHSIISDDEKNDTLIYKFLLYDQFVRQNRCRACIREVATLDTHDLIRSFRLGRCVYGHRLSDNLTTYPWIRSFVTVERLRKDCDSFDQSVNKKDLPFTIKGTEMSFLVMLASSDRMIRRMQRTPYRIPKAKDSDPYCFKPGHPNIFHLLTIMTMPTSTVYKIGDVMRDVQPIIRGRDCLCIGDGLGSSSLMLKSMGCSSVFSSTLLEPDEAIPHSYVHNVAPMSLSYSAKMIDSNSAILLNNDVRSEKWRRDWSVVIDKVAVIYSDAEIINPDAHLERQTLFRKLISVGPKDLIVIKDYIWTKEELSNRIGTIQSIRCRRWELVTSHFKSYHYPEVWWRVYETSENSEMSDSAMIGNPIDILWREILGHLSASFQGLEPSEAVSEACADMTPIEGIYKMRTYIDGWCHFPVIGSLLPVGGLFTPLYLYLLRAKRPKFIKVHTEGNEMKLYDSDYLKLRARMFALAVSMLSSIADRVEMLRESIYWHLEWHIMEEKWDVRLVKSKKIQPPCDVVKYIPILNLIMKENHLLFKSLHRSNTIIFKPDKKREYLCFPITKKARESRRADEQLRSQSTENHVVEES